MHVDNLDHDISARPVAEDFPKYNPSGSAQTGVEVSFVINSSLEFYSRVTFNQMLT